MSLLSPPKNSNPCVGNTHILSPIAEDSQKVEE